MRPVGGRVSAWVLASVTVFVVSACSAGEEKQSVTLGQPSATPTPSVAVATQVPDEPREGEMIRGASAAETAAEQEAAETWFSYFDQLVHMWSTPVADRASFSRLATGPAFDGPFGYAQELVSGERRLAGGAIVHLTEVSVKDESVSIVGCVQTTMHEVDASGKQLEGYQPWLEATNTLVWEGTTWRVREHRLRETDRCA